MSIWPVRFGLAYSTDAPWSVLQPVLQAVVFRRTSSCVPALARARHGLTVLQAIARRACHGAASQPWRMRALACAAGRRLSTYTHTVRRDTTVSTYVETRRPVAHAKCYRPVVRRARWACSTACAADHRVSTYAFLHCSRAMVRAAVRGAAKARLPAHDSDKSHGLCCRPWLGEPEAD
jgi:hypothetical protein